MLSAAENFWSLDSIHSHHVILLRSPLSPLDQRHGQYRLPPPRAMFEILLSIILLWALLRFVILSKLKLLRVEVCCPAIFKLRAKALVNAQCRTGSCLEKFFSSSWLPWVLCVCVCVCVCCVCVVCVVCVCVCVCVLCVRESSCSVIVCRCVDWCLSALYTVVVN